MRHKTLDDRTKLGQNSYIATKTGEIAPWKVQTLPRV